MHLYIDMTHFSVLHTCVYCPGVSDSSFFMPLCRCIASLKQYACLVATRPDIHPDHLATKDVKVILEALLTLRLDLAVLEVLASRHPHLPALQAALKHHQASPAALGRIRRTSSDGSTASNSSRTSPSPVPSLLQQQQQQQSSSGSLTGLVQQQPGLPGQQQLQQQLGCRSHVLVLYEHLVLCIVGGDLQVRQLLEKLLVVAGQEMQLIAAG